MIVKFVKTTNVPWISKYEETSAIFHAFSHAGAHPQFNPVKFLGGAPLAKSRPYQEGALKW